MMLSRRREAAAPAEEAAFATVIDAAGRRLLAAVNRAASTAGLVPGMPLADALSFLPGLATAAAEPAEDVAALRRLAEWCGRYSPWTAPDGTDGVKIEITGCAHLWGGEGALAADLIARLDRQGISGRIAIANTLGAAWAVARFAEACRSIVIQPSAKMRAGLAVLPVEALRLDPATAQGLRRVGLKRVGDLYAMPRDTLMRRFGEVVARRLDQALDDLPEPLSPLAETPARRVRLSFAEPIADPADFALAAERLAEDLVTRLAREGTGARRLALAFHRVDGRVERIMLGTAHPSRDPRHLAALFKERLDTIDPGLGVEDMILAAFAVEPLPPEQIGFSGSFVGEGTRGVAALLDRLGNRLGLAALSRIEARESHIPERASVRVPIGEPAAPVVTRTKAGGRPTPGSGSLDLRFRGDDGIRPIRLFEPPEPVEASWLLPDDPPFRFTWRRRAHRVKRADGPERIAEEWWRPGASEAVDAIRDYYRVEDEEGRRFWLFRAALPGGGQPPRWYVHGVFA
jgi:protein ImuB